MTIKTNLPAFGNIILNGERIADLRAIPFTRIQPGYTAIIAGKLTPTDGLGGIFHWNPDSTAADDDAKIIAPRNAAVGRWIMSVGGPNYKAPESLPAPPYSGTKSVNAKLDEIVALDDAREAGDTSDDAALQRLIDRGFRRIRLRAGKGLGANGEYLIGTKPWSGVMPGRPTDSTDALDMIEYRGNLTTTTGIPAHGLHLMGDGQDRTVIFQGDNNYLFAHNSMSNDMALNLVGFTLTDLTLRGNNSGHNGAQHLIALGGVTGGRFERVTYRGFNADATILWMGPRPDTQRQNRDFVWRDCLFDGVNNQNRNAISIECCVNWTVDHCVFRNVCMPDDNISVAAIDVEPRGQAAYSNGNGTVSNCTFQNIQRSAVALYTNNNEYYTVKTRAFRLINNTLSSCFRGFDLNGSPTGEQITQTLREQVLIAFNQMNDVEVPTRMMGVYGVDYIYNQHDNVGSVYMGVDQVGKRIREVRVDNNSFSRAGRTLGAVCLVDDDVTDSSFSYNFIANSGRTDNLGGWVMLARAGSVGLKLNYNKLRNPKGSIKAFAQLGGTSTLGIGAQKQGNELYDVAMNVPDNFDPPAVKFGLSFTYELTLGAVIPSNGAAYFDVGVAGANSTKFFKAKFDAYPPTSAVLTITAYPTQQNVVRVIVRNSGPSWTVPQGAFITISEDL